MLQEIDFKVDNRDSRKLAGAAGLKVVAQPRRYGGSQAAANDWLTEVDAISRQGLLSVLEVVERIGVSEARLREISDFYWELVDMGCRPFGCPPVRIGNQCFYATETLDHWFGDSV